MILSYFFSSYSSSFCFVYYKQNRELQLEDLLSQGEEKCLNKPCVQSEQCCPGSVCVDTTHPNGKRQGIIIRSNNLGT